jgi:hypothetical protein
VCALRFDLSSAEVKQMVYCWNICFGHYSSYVDKDRVCSLLLLLDVFVEVMNMSATHLQMLLIKQPSC